MDDAEEPSREWGARAAARDVVAGALLAILGFATGGSALVEGHDRLDVLFDGLAAAWMLWGLTRLVRATRRGTEPVGVPWALASVALALLAAVAWLAWPDR